MEGEDSSIRRRKTTPGMVPRRDEAPGLGGFLGEGDNEGLLLHNASLPGGNKAQQNGRPVAVPDGEVPYSTGETLELTELTFGSSDVEEDPLIREDEVEVIKHEADESSWVIALQVFLPYIVAGCGMVAAGLVLDHVQHWRVYEEVSEIFILVPALLGLKGNLEMTLASRLSTHANLGRMDCPKEQFKHIGGNLALVQVQATAVAFLASGFAIVLGWIPKGEFKMSHALLLCASSMTTGALASFLLGLIMVGVILLSRRYSINPDNVATPIAASLGDLITLLILSWITTLLFKAQLNDNHWLAKTIIALFILLTPLWIWISWKNVYTRKVLFHGWSPVILAMLVSSAGGFILDLALAVYGGIAVFQPVINGVGGNLVAVQASRLSTWLHGSGRPLGELPADASGACHNPLKVFCASHVHARAIRVLLLLVIPGHLLFIYLIHILKAGHTSITPLFTVIYLLAALIQVAILLYICDFMVQSMWKNKTDPDNAAIPYLTALGDLFGTALLALAFHILFLLGDRDADVGE